MRRNLHFESLFHIKIHYKLCIQLRFFLLPILFYIGIITYGQEIQTYKYHIGTTPPDAGWQEKGYIDSSWPDGQGSIGYGDGDDDVITGVTPSVYIRSEVLIDSYWLSHITAIVIKADFDDGFVAYLNGKEIIRVNMDTTLHPGNLETTIRSHEAELYRDQYVDLQGYYIDTTILNNCNLDTVNILAFEVHNDSINGSDLSFLFDVSTINLDDYYFNYWGDRFLRQLPLDSIDVPIVKIETDEYGYVFNESKIATMGIIYNGKGLYNKLSDSCNDYNGYIRIRGRGQTSAEAPKPSFRIELQDSLGENNNTKIMDLPEENDFILYGPFADQSLIRNELVFKLGKEMGHYEPRTRFCELILNGRDLGLYIMTENIKRDDKRVDVAKLTSTDNSGIDVTGGYIFKWDKEYSEAAGRVEMVYPELDKLTYQQEEYIYGYLNHLDTVLNSNDFMDTYTGYRRYLDIESLADYMIINELTKNIDAYFYSCYMYKDRDDRGGVIEYGPLWDYDFSMGYSLWGDISTVSWQFDDSYKVPKIPLSRILQDTGFVHLSADRWHNYRQDLLNNDTLFNLIDSIVAPLQDNIDRNYEIWPMMGKMLYSTSYSGSSYGDEITKLKSWLTSRMSWIDSHVDGIYKPLVIYTGTYEINSDNNIAYCYPNPFNEYLSLAVDLETAGLVSLEIYDLSGRKIKDIDYHAVSAGRNDFSVDITDIQNPGVYILKVLKDNIPITSQRIIKIN